MDSKIRSLLTKIHFKIKNSKGLYESHKSEIRSINKLLDSMKGGNKMTTTKISELKKKAMNLHKKMKSRENKRKQSKKINIGNNKNLKLNLNKRTRNTHVNKDKLFEPIGILDPEGKNPNPLTGKDYENIYAPEVTYTGLSKNVWSALPMYSIREEVIQKIHDNQVTLIVSGTGSGKTVLAPKLALHALNYQGKIMITNPKQIPSKENAEFAAKCLDVPLGSDVGYKYRGSDPSGYSSDNKLLYCTDGYVLAKMKTDPYLTEYDAIMIDEAHERNMRIDLLLLETKELITRRPDFKLIIMSATIDENIFINYFPKKEFKFDVIRAEGKPHFPVESIFLPKGGEVNKFDKDGNLVNKLWIDKMVEIIMKILKESDGGDILAFVTGKGDSADVCTQLRTKIKNHNSNNSPSERIYCTPLSGQSKDEEKNFAIHKNKYKTKNDGYDRKLVVATEVAESSITVKGLMYVVDSGLANQQRYYSQSDIEALERRYISKASHKQRLGRVGRTEPGVCYNIFTEKEYKDLFPEYTPSPIKMQNVTLQILNFMNKIKLVSHVDLPFKYNRKRNNVSKNTTYPMSLNDYLMKLIEEPYEDTVAEAIKRLIALGALEKKDDKAYLTYIGVGMNRFDSIPVEMSRALMSSYDYNCANEMSNIAALIELVDGQLEKVFLDFKPDRRMNRNEQDKEKKKHRRVRDRWTSSDGDLISFLKAYAVFEEKKYDKVNRRTGNVYEEKTGDAAEWCKENYIKAGLMNRIRRTATDYRKKLFGYINYKKRLMQENGSYDPNKEFTFIYPEKPELDANKYKNVLSALCDGFYTKLLRKTTKKNYMSCFPKDKMVGSIEKYSLYGGVKIPAKYTFYVEFGSIFGNTSFRIMTPVSPSEIKRIKSDKNREEYVHTCLSESTFEKTMKEKTQKSSRSGKKGKKYYGKKKKHYGKKKK